MAASYGLRLLLMLCCCSNIVFAEDHKDPEGEISKNPNNGQKEIMKPKDENGKALSYSGCGFRTPKIQENSTQTGNKSRKGGSDIMVGGNKAEENSWPWMVVMNSTGEDGSNTSKPLSCSASLISQKYALTAAHCFLNESDPSKISVVVGAHSLSNGTKYPLSKILIHPNYTTENQQHDIALIEFEKPIELSKRVYPVCLPSTGLTDKIETNRSMIIATEWGPIADDAGQALVEISASPVSLEVCKAFFENVTKGQICAVGQAPCMGDFGGPLVYKMKDNSYVQVGIVSYGSKSFKHGWPTVYTRVSEYSNWIYDNSDLLPILESKV